jgi:microcystin-dependent protein
MSNCNGCSNGCVSITSDQCIKYTGNAIPSLGIETGDSLAQVELAIATYLLTVMNGSGIVPNFAEGELCDIISDNLPLVGDITLNDIINALIMSICTLKTSLVAAQAAITTLNADYNIDCLTGVTNSSDTHLVVQAVIDLACSLSTDLVALTASLTQYVKTADIDTYIAAYLADIVPSDKMYTKMVPYVAVPYFGSLIDYPASGDSFNNGVGIGAWEYVYLCNGLNGTPDLRGTIVVGATSMGSNAYGNPNVDPANGHPFYVQGTLYGTTKEVLDTTKIPAHTHANTANIVPNPHSHTFDGSGDDTIDNSGVNGRGIFGQDNNRPGTYTGSMNTISLSVAMNNQPTGDGGAHNNVPPVIGSNFIMYKP